MARRSIAGAIKLLARAVETIAPTAGCPEIRLRSPASRAIFLEWMQWSRHAASQRRKPSRSKELARALKIGSQLART
jgi:hypothetical protein